MAAHAAYDCSPFILMHTLIYQEKCRDADRLKRGETHTYGTRMYVYTHHIYS